jgi:hypothetical protein
LGRARGSSRTAHPTLRALPIDEPGRVELGALVIVDRVGDGAAAPAPAKLLDRESFPAGEPLYVWWRTAGVITAWTRSRGTRATTTTLPQCRAGARDPAAGDDQAPVDSQAPRREPTKHSGTLDGLAPHGGLFGRADVPNALSTSMELGFATRPLGQLGVFTIPLPPVREERDELLVRRLGEEGGQRARIGLVDCQAVGLDDREVGSVLLSASQLDQPS